MTPRTDSGRGLWRQLWLNLNLVLAEKEVGLPITDEAIEQMRANLVHLYPSPPFHLRAELHCTRTSHRNKSPSQKKRRRKGDTP